MAPAPGAAPSASIRGVRPVRATDYLPGGRSYTYTPLVRTPQGQSFMPDHGSGTADVPQIEVIYATEGPQALPARLQAKPSVDDRNIVLAYQPIYLLPPDSLEVPFHVQFIARCAEFALWRLLALGFRRPALGPNGGKGDDRLRIVLRDTQGFRGLTSPEWDHVEVSNTLVGVQALMTVGHEIFHRVQYAYNATERAKRTSDDRGVDFWLLVFEGGARFAEDLLVDGQNRYSFDAARWFTIRRRPLARSTGEDGGLSGASYEAALFWKYVAEQHGDALETSLETRRSAGGAGRARGATPEYLARVLGNWQPDPHVVVEARNHRRILDAIATDRGGDVDIRSLRNARSAMLGVGLLDHAVPVDTGGSGEPGLLVPDSTWTNFVTGIALNGQSGEDSRFEFREQPEFRGAGGQFAEISGGRTVGYGDLPLDEPGSAELNIAGGQIAFTRDSLADARVERLGDNLWRWLRGERRLPDLPPMLRPYDMVMFKVVMPGGPRTHLLRVEWDPSDRLTQGGPGMLNDGVVQVVMLGPGGHLVDIHRHDASLSRDGRLRRTFPCRNVENVLILVCSREGEGNFRLVLSRRERTPVLFATSWNCPSGKGLTHDPATFEWTWMSPDLDVVTDYGMTDRTTGRLGSRKVRLAVQNLGDFESVSRRGSVQFAWRPWREGSTGKWTLLGDPVPLGPLFSVERYERESRGGRVSDETRMLGKRFVEASLDSAPEEPLIIRATITEPIPQRQDQPLVVLGSSEPISREQIRITDQETGAWVFATAPQPASVRSRPRAGTTLRVRLAPRPAIVPFRIDR